jgi:phosphoribosylanthranilate isomerase
MLTQIYEASTPEEARTLSAIGVDHIGVLVGPGLYPREQPLKAAAKIAAAVSPTSKFTALFMSTDVTLIADWIKKLRPPVLHLGAHADKITPADVQTLKQKAPDTLIMRSIPVGGPVSGAESVAIAQSYDNIADFLLLDSIRSDGQFGALGVTHDWSVSRRIVEQVQIPVFLAGGLGPDNVAEAIRVVQPAGVDSFSRTNKDGTYVKDFDRVRQFHEAAQSALVA